MNKRDIFMMEESEYLLARIVAAAEAASIKHEKNNMNEHDKSVIFVAKLFMWLLAPALLLAVLLIVWWLIELA